MKKTLSMRICVAAIAAAAALSSARAEDLVAPKAGASATADQIRADGVLKAGVIVNPPFIMQDPIKNEYTGPAADFINAAAAGLGAKVEWVPVNWDTMIAGLQAKQYEVLATAVYATEARKKVVDFVNYSRSGICYFARKDNDKVNSLQDIKDNKLTMVVGSGVAFAADLPVKYPKLEIITKQMPAGNGNFFDDVLTGRADLSHFESLIAPQILASQPDLKVVPKLDECLSKPDFPIDIGIAINKGDQAFEEYLGKAVAAAAPAIEKAVKESTGK